MGPYPAQLRFLMRTHVLQVRLETPRPFRLKQVVETSGYHEALPFQWVAGSGELRRTLTLPGGTGALIICREAPNTRPRGNHCELDIEIHSNAPVRRASTTEAAVTAAVRHMFMFDVDLRPYYAACKNHPVLRALSRTGGGRVLRSPSLYEEGVKAIAWTNITWPQAVRSIAAIVNLGILVPTRHGARCFPTPRQLLAAGEKYLRETARVGYRAPYILDWADHALNDSAFAALERALAPNSGRSSAELTKLLLAYKGVGKATAHYLLNLSGRFDQIAIDSVAYAHVAATHLQGRKPTESEIRALYAPFAPFDHLAFWHEMHLVRRHMARSAQA